MQINQQKGVFYIVEHFEDDLFDWSVSEMVLQYSHIVLMLAGLYNDSISNSSLILTNFKYTSLMSKKQIPEDEEVLEFIQTFEQLRSTFKGRVLVSKLTLEQLAQNQNDQSAFDHDDTHQLITMFTQKPLQGDCCFMDMRAQEQLKPQDNFQYVVLAGIVGDNPPQDRAAELRNGFAHLRNLGSAQMKTDTALHVIYEILEHKKELKDIQFVDDPRIPIDTSIIRFSDEIFGTKILENVLVAVRANKNEMTEDLPNLVKVKQELILQSPQFKEAIDKERSIRKTETIQQEEETVIEGFRYKVDDMQYCISHKQEWLKSDSKFPLLPIGMLKLWRKQMSDGQEFVPLSGLLDWKFK